MTADGFSPPEVTIDVSSAVIFINKDSSDHWPASNPHPVHDLYPEFDPQMPISPGKSWAFKPKKVGEWKYHDHLNPHRGGLIKVTPEKGQALATQSNEQRPGLIWIQAIKNFLTKIFRPKIVLDKDQFVKSSPADQIAQLKKYADSRGAEAAWQFVKDTFKDQAGSSGNIHDLAHLSGALLFEKLNFVGLSKCTVQFAFGCYHGFLDQAFAKDLDHLNQAQAACLKLGPQGSGPVGSCIHGIGHGVASFRSTADLRGSLADCRKLTSGKEFCFDGVFMEFVRSAPDGFYKQDDPLYPCDDLEKEFGYAYSSACGRNQPSVLMGRFKMGFEEIVNICQNSTSNQFKQACFDSLGFSLAATADVDKIVGGCQVIGTKEYIATCMKSAAGELIFQEIPGWDQKSQAVCNVAPPSGRNTCFEHIQRIISDYGRKK